MEELAVYAGIARKDIDAAMDSLGARQGKLDLIKLCALTTHGPAGHAAK